ncbi:hypothetical protein BDP55DRAFT_302451 [Colletotrichum godetiae]|uniref:Uncharacterized protein n=1 Tax=Colletotrichum godetiae TaxID=1209918 RepID=A0AAJ0AUL8_9PEZI|nr:uncharacterized protein BDP55DRAFT_302451 [Colletotrichum godetiae]KAK1690667.1 hypothetical protein BDP55DRAFT_302451 [Colletotrichum godetiae]
MNNSTTQPSLSKTNIEDSLDPGGSSTPSYAPAPSVTGPLASAVISGQFGCWLAIAIAVNMLIDFLGWSVQDRQAKRRPQAPKHLRPVGGPFGDLPDSCPVAARTLVAEQETDGHMVWPAAWLNLKQAFARFARNPGQLDRNKVRIWAWSPLGVSVPLAGPGPHGFLPEPPKVPCPPARLPSRRR